MGKQFRITNHRRILGFKACFNNACALYEEAQLLFDKNKWARATSLFILGIEEISKIEMIAQTFFYNDNNQWKNFESNFAKHSRKLRLANSMFLQILYKKGNQKELEEEIKEILSGRNINYAKQLCIYVGYSQERGWDSPLEIVTKEDAEGYSKILKLLIDTYKELINKSHNELVDLVKAMKKHVRSELAENSSKKMQNDIKSLFNKLKTPKQ